MSTRDREPDPGPLKYAPKWARTVGPEEAARRNRPRRPSAEPVPLRAVQASTPPPSPPIPPPSAPPSSPPPSRHRAPSRPRERRRRAGEEAARRFRGRRRDQGIARAHGARARSAAVAATAAGRRSARDRASARGPRRAGGDRGLRLRVDFDAASSGRRSPLRRGCRPSPAAISSIRRPPARKTA